MNFAMADVKNVTQLDILRGDERLSTVNVTGNNTISVGPRMQVDIQTSNDSFRVILTLKKVTCHDEGIYVVVAKVDDREETKSVNLNVFSEYLLPSLLLKSMCMCFKAYLQTLKLVNAVKHYSGDPIDIGHIKY